MVDLTPGRHPNFDITIFDVPQQRALRRLEKVFHLTRHGHIRISETSTYKYALALPTSFVRSLVHTHREVLILFSDYEDFQTRTIDAFDKIIESQPEFRVEKVVRLLVSSDAKVTEKIKRIFEGKPESPVIVPFYVNELSTTGVSDEFLFQRMREFTFSRDLFSMSSPLRSDLFFYGRSQLINEICSKLSAGENFSLFGLRRSGKTSIVNGIERALPLRSCRGITIDCSNPSVHQKRWNKLLYYIIKQIKEIFSLEINISKEENYSLDNASDSFYRDIKALRGKVNVDKIVILFDEIERISFGTASSAHWNDDRDFLHFWQAIRAGFQKQDSPFTFLVVGTNPSAFEISKIHESDNPLFGNIEKRYMPMFTFDQTKEMSQSLGQIMGIQFDDLSISRLFEDFGGHPFLTRYACSFIAKKVLVRPVSIDRSQYVEGFKAFSAESDSYISSVVEMLEEYYPNEFEMLKYLGVGEQEKFIDLASAYPSLVDHLVGYGIVRKEANGFNFNIGIVSKYFENVAKPILKMTLEERWKEISQKRNHIEVKIRKFIRQSIQIQVAQSKQLSIIMESLSGERRERMSGYSFRELVSETASFLYFSDLVSIISRNWDYFKNAIQLDKPEFVHHANVVNKLRADAHAKEVADDALDEFRVSIKVLEQRILFE